MAKLTKQQRAEMMRKQKLAKAKKSRQALQRKVRAKKRREEKADIALYGSIENAKAEKQKTRIAKRESDQKKIGVGVLSPDSVRAASGDISYATPKRRR